jgi:hypothetical protein
VGSVAWQGITKAGFTDMNAYLSSNSALLNIAASESATALTLVQSADMPTGGTVILRFCINYLVA